MNILSMMGKKYTAYPNVKSVWLGRRSVQMPRPLKTQKSSFVTEECSRLHGHFFPKSPAVDCLEEMLTRNHKNKKFNLSSPQSESSSSLFNSTVLENHMLRVMSGWRSVAVSRVRNLFSPNGAKIAADQQGLQA